MRRLCSEGVRAYLGRSRFVPERATVVSQSEKSAEVVVVSGWAGEAETAGEGPKERESGSG